MFPWDESTLAPVEAPREVVDGRKRRASAALPAARRRRPTSNWRPAAGWARRTSGSPSQSPPAPAHLSAQPIYSHGKVPMNRDGFMVRLGTQPGFRGRWYCGRILDPLDVPGASDQCGPEGGPQCRSCADFQKYYEPDLNDDGYPVKRSTSTKSCYNFYCGRPGVVAGTGGTCGPYEGPQCPSCQRLQESFKSYYVNDEGCQLMLGTTSGYRGNYYCGRVLGVQAVPGSDGRCGPADGPQCASCKRFQKTQQIVIDEDPKPNEVEIEETSKSNEVKKEPAPARTTRKRAGLQKVKQEPAPEARKGSRKAKAKTVTTVATTPGSRISPMSSPGSTMSSPTPSSPSRSPSRSVSRSGSPLIRTRVEVHETPNRTYCSECSKDTPAGLLMCGMMGPNCRIATHARCCNPPLKKMPTGDWYCEVCRVNSQRPVLHCSVCGLGDRPEELLLCDGGVKGCHRVTHLSCCTPALKAVPTGEWFCTVCVKTLGGRQPAAQKPKDIPKARVPETKVNPKGSGKGQGHVYSNLGDALKVAAAQRQISPKASPKTKAKAKERVPRTLD